MRLLAAPDKFRGSATGPQVAAAVAAAAQEHGHTCVQLPLADGGEGMLEAFGGPNRTTEVTGPLGAPVLAGWRLDEGWAVLESALASGLVLAGGAEHNDPVHATSRGTGELLAAAIAAGATEVTVGVGGSAMTDGGRGAVEVLAGLGRLDGTGDAPAVSVCCDVTTRYLDAAPVFGPQKGATPEQVTMLRERLAADAAWLEAEFGVDVREVPGSGAAGGLAGGLAALGARLVPGFAHIADTVGLPARLAEADLVVTGEGRLDATSYAGKVVGGVLRQAAEAGVPVLVVAGMVDEDVAGRARAVSLVERFGLQASMADAAGCVRVAVSEVLASGAWR